MSLLKSHYFLHFNVAFNRHGWVRLGFRDGCFIESKHIVTEWATERERERQKKTIEINQYLNMY